MERIKVNIPENFSFSVKIAIRITDINYGKHVGNDTFLSFIHEARMQYLQQLGFSEMDVAGYSLIMADVAIEFKKELKYNDNIVCHVQAANFNKLGFDIFYKLEIISIERNTVAALAKTGMMCFDYKEGKKVMLPNNFEQHFIL